MSNNFEYFQSNCYGQTYLPYSYLPEVYWQNYHQFPVLSYIWPDFNLNNQQTTSFVPYFCPTIVSEEVQNCNKNKQKTEQIVSTQNQCYVECKPLKLHYSTEKSQLKQKMNQIQVQPRQDLSFTSGIQKLMKLRSKDEKMDQKNFQNSQILQKQQILTYDKRSQQNLRYQRKNIQANIVNKIYTFLKNSLKNGLLSSCFMKCKQKAKIYYKTLEKMQKIKKQQIKRQFIKGLLSIDWKITGFLKLKKQLEKQGEDVFQFQYYMRIIIKNYLRFHARSSILTSKKMNPTLWKDHLSKIRELYDYLFQNNQLQDKEKQINDSNKQQN